MSHEVVLVGRPGRGTLPPDEPGGEWQAFYNNAVARLHLMLTQQHSGEVTVRQLEADSPEVLAYPQAQARLAEVGARFPLVLIDGQLVGEGAFSAGTIAAYLRDGQIPKSP